MDNGYFSQRFYKPLALQHMRAKTHNAHSRFQPILAKMFFIFLWLISFLCGQTLETCNAGVAQQYQTTAPTKSRLDVFDIKITLSGIGSTAHKLLSLPNTAAKFYSVSFYKPNPLWFGKITPKKCVGFSKPILVWFGNKKIISKTQIPNQIQIGLGQFDDQCQLPENSKHHCASLRRYTDPFFTPKFGFHFCYISRPRL